MAAAALSAARPCSSLIATTSPRSTLHGPEIPPQNPCYTDYVANLTLSIDGELLKRARIKALEQGTSVNAVVREQLRSYVGDGQPEARRRIAENARRSSGGSGPDGRSWTREDLYEDRMVGKGP